VLNFVYCGVAAFFAQSFLTGDVFLLT